MTTQKIAYGTVFFFLIMTSLANAQELNWGENVGPISAIIVASDSAQDLPCTACLKRIRRLSATYGPVR